MTMRLARMLIVPALLPGMLPSATNAASNTAPPRVLDFTNCGPLSGPALCGKQLCSIDPIAIAIDARGAMRWNGQSIGGLKFKSNLEAVARDMQGAGPNDPPPAFSVVADAATPYGKVAAVLLVLKKLGAVHVQCRVP